MSLREEMWKYEQITGESAEHVPIIKLGAFLDGYEMGLKALEQKWIPVSERLPGEEDYISCIECLDGAVWYFTENGTMGIGYYYESTKEWSTTDDLKTDGKVVAWMPLPKPYKGGEQNE